MRSEWTSEALGCVRAAGEGPEGGLTAEQKAVKLLAAHIRKLRGERGLSQERLAELAQMHRTYLGGIETARRNPSFKNLYRLARALGVSLSELFETVK
jgi:DNA-binding XRE family transcriptional regulator